MLNQKSSIQKVTKPPGGSSWFKISRDKISPPRNKIKLENISPIRNLEKEKVSVTLPQIVNAASPKPAGQAQKQVLKKNLQKEKCSTFSLKKNKFTKGIIENKQIMDNYQNA